MDSCVPEEKELKMHRWSVDQAWDWYKSRPWIRGFNYVASDCVNRIEQWQELDHAAKEDTFGREFALASEAGFNAVRSILPFEVWQQEHDGFMERLESFLHIAHRHGIDVMIVFGNDCTVPKERYTPPVLGPQPVDWGYHGGVARSPHDVLGSPGYSVLDEPALAEQFAGMVDEVVGRYAHDARVNIWDLFNEPGNSLRESMSLPHVRRFFDVARSHEPDQPLTAGPWRVRPSGELSEIEQAAMDMSDVITFHDYGAYTLSVKILDRLKREGRPLLNTEWLHRMQGNDVATHLPLYFLERVGCYNWGLVAGKSQTYEPWEAIWRRREAGQGDHYDFTKWQHDLFRPNLRPYDPDEVEILSEYTQLADDHFRQGLW